jgi:hypothetical protein
MRDSNGYSLRILKVARDRAAGITSADEAIVLTSLAMCRDEVDRNGGRAIDGETAMHFGDCSELRLMEALDYLRMTGEIR